MSAFEFQAEAIGGSDIDWSQITVSGLRQALKSGTITSAELVRFYLGRIERLNVQLGAVISVAPDAVGQANAIDAARAASPAGGSAARRADGSPAVGSPGAGGPALGPLAGIPVLVKDNISAAGAPATAGSPALLGAAGADAFAIARLREAGAVILGKANLSEWANFRSTQSTSGWSTLGGQAVNPYGTGRNPSGSSSGSAVAVAAGLAPLAVGTETDGSIVSPSHCCGIVGVKPTVGLVSRAGIVPISLAQDTAGPMARCVADAAALLGALAGADPADEATAQAAGQPADYEQFLDAGALAGARIGVWRGSAAEATAATVALLDSVVGLLRARGAVVVDPVELAEADKIADPAYSALRHEFRRDLNAYLAGLDGEHPMSLAELISFNSANADRVLIHFGQQLFEQAEATSGTPESDFALARAQALSLARSGLDGVLGDHGLDAVLALSGNPAWLTDYVLGDQYSAGSSTPAAVAGYPSITVPVGQVSGLPVGVSLIGTAWSEPRLLALAYSLEQALRVP